MRKTSLLAGLMLAFLAVPGSAQLQSSGVNPGVNTVGTGGVSQGWTVSWTSNCSGSYAAPAPVGGVSPEGIQCGTSNGVNQSAFIVDDVFGTWQQQSDAVAPRWMSAWTNSSTTCQTLTGDPVTCDAVNPFAEHYRYDYNTTFTSVGAGYIYFEMAWDNILAGFTVNGVYYTPASQLVSPVGYPFADRYGFCRDGDGMYASGDWAGSACSSLFRIQVENGVNTFGVTVLGDGQTDALFLAVEDGGLTQEIVPEPATMTLLATGLAGMAAARRRRNTAKA